MNPRHRLLAIVLACVLAVLASTQALAHWAARTAHEAMVEQRDHYLLHSLRTAAENYLAIGLNLEQMEALQTLIERERASFDQVLAIDVFAASGTLLYSTDPNALGSQVPPHWRQGLEHSTPWHTDGPAQRQLAVRFPLRQRQGRRGGGDGQHNAARRPGHLGRLGWGGAGYAPPDGALCARGPHPARPAASASTTTGHATGAGRPPHPRQLGRRPPTRTTPPAPATGA